MSYTQTQLDDLRAAYASGVRRVIIDGKQVIYGSGAEMLQAISIIERSLTSSVTPVQSYNPVFSKGV